MATDFFIITEILILTDTEWDLLHMQKNQLLSFKLVNLMLFMQINNTFEGDGLNRQSENGSWKMKLSNVLSSTCNHKLYIYVTARYVISETFTIIHIF